ncbi:hypothetical protein [Pantoea ananatis]|uniref:hypothetical protein n=1 Tax=Pantoea ananas TaxID=553 RepID=UPI003C182464
MPGIELSAQPIKTTISRGNHGQIFIITTRPMPEHPDATRNILCCSTMIKIGDPVRLLPGKARAVTKWGRLLLQCRQAKESNHNRIHEAVALVRWRGFDAIEAV